jgi:hypothetical protein
VRALEGTVVELGLDPEQVRPILGRRLRGSGAHNGGRQFLPRLRARSHGGGALYGCGSADSPKQCARIVSADATSEHRERAPRLCVDPLAGLQRAEYRDDRFRDGRHRRRDISHDEGPGAHARGAPACRRVADPNSGRYQVRRPRREPTTDRDPNRRPRAPGRSSSTPPAAPGSRQPTRARRQRQRPLDDRLGGASPFLLVGAALSLDRRLVTDDDVVALQELAVVEVLAADVALMPASRPIRQKRASFWRTRGAASSSPRRVVRRL